MKKKTNKTKKKGDFVKDPSQKANQLSFNQMMIAGSLGGLIQIVLTYPLEVIRTRLSLSEKLSSNQKYKGIIDCYSKIVRKEGFIALYKGLGPTIVVGTPYVGLQMSFYDIYKRMNNNLFFSDQEKKNETLVILSNLFSGALAGLTAQNLTYPGDTLRRRLQTNGIGGEKKKYRNSFDAISKIYRMEGIRGFFKGILLNSYRVLPSSAIQFACYDFLKSIFGI